MPGIPNPNSAFTDVFVIGGGPAGLAAAIALRSRGFDVTVADSARPPIDKTCGEGLMPGAIAALRSLGVTLSPEHSFPYRGIRFLGQAESARHSGNTLRVDASFPEGTGIGVRRTHLHQVLVDRAIAVGVNLLWGTSVRGLSPTGVVTDREVTCRWVIGADGENSRVRRWAGLDGAVRESRRFGFRRHYRMKPWSDCVEIYWGAGYQLYMTAISPDEVCLAVISRDSHLRLDHVLPNFPELNLRLKGAPVTSSERGAISATRRLKRVYRDRVILIGDASGSVDAVTGEGLRLSFEQSIALAEALAADDVGLYQSAHRRLAMRPEFMTHFMLCLDRSSWLRRKVLGALAAEPGIFASLLAMHVGDLSTPEFLRQGIIPLGRGILMT